MKNGLEVLGIKTPERIWSVRGSLLEVNEDIVRKAE